MEYIKLDTCAKFHDHRSNNNKVMMGDLIPPPPPPHDCGLKKAHMSNRVKATWYYDCRHFHANMIVQTAAAKVTITQKVEQLHA